MKQNLTASENPIKDIEAITYAGQNPNRRIYKSGYEHFMNQMPVLRNDDSFLNAKVGLTRVMMQNLSNELATQQWVKDMLPTDGEFKRVILAIESPNIDTQGKLQEGSELVLALWGNGFSSPIHGHAAGYLHEDIVSGRMLVNTYRMKNPKSNTVRLVRSEIVSNGTFASRYTTPNPKDKFKRQALIHNFTAIGASASLHYLPEHTRDGRDNGFKVEYFDDIYFPGKTDVKQITSKEGLYSRVGDVLLVRSTNVPEYGDHYIVITGHPVIKEHGLRPQDVAFIAPTNTLLDQFEMKNGLTLLKLNERARNAFLAFHGITVMGDKVIFPTA